MRKNSFIRKVCARVMTAVTELGVRQSLPRGATTGSMSATVDMAV